MPISRRQFLKSAVAVPIGFAGLQRNLTWGEPEVIEAVARWQWYETHKAKCPDEQIPTETDLLDFWTVALKKSKQYLPRRQQIG